MYKAFWLSLLLFAVGYKLLHQHTLIFHVKRSSGIHILLESVGKCFPKEVMERKAQVLVQSQSILRWLPDSPA